MPSASHERKQRLHRLLHDGHALSYDDLTDRLDVGTRQARRVVKALREDGTPVRERREGRRKVFYLDAADRELDAPTPSFTERELLALTVAAEAGEATLGPTPLGDPLRSAFGKLLDRQGAGVLSFEPEHTPRHWHFDAGPVPKLSPGIFETVRQAITESRSLVISYTASDGTESWDRRVDPYVVAALRGSWILVAYCRESGHVTNFALPAISEAEPDEPFAGRPAGFDPELRFREAFGAMSDDEVHVVRLRAEPGAVQSFHRKAYHPTQQIEREEDDGSLIVSYEVAGLREIASFVQSWGASVTVLEPPALAERIRRTARRVAERYESDY
jgi:proteasome accessory factor B